VRSVIGTAARRGESAYQAIQQTNKPCAGRSSLTWVEQLLGFFQFVHNARRCGKALLDAFIAALVA